MRILYLLPFKNNIHFKIGVTKDVNRLFILDKIYGINFENAEFIYSDKVGSIDVLERLLKTIWSETIDEYNGANGWKEIREISIYQDVRKEIAKQNIKLGYKFFKYGELLKFLEKTKENSMADRLVKKYDLKLNVIFQLSENYAVFEIRNKHLLLTRVDIDFETKRVKHKEEYIINDFNPLGAKRLDTLYLFNKKGEYQKAIVNYVEQLKYTGYAVESR